MRTFTIGVDVGRVNDPTAVVYGELIRREADTCSPAHLKLPPGVAPCEAFDVVHLMKIERLPLGMPFRQQIAHIKTYVTTNKVLRAASLAITIDATGVGAGVVELAREANLPGLLPLSICSGTGSLKNRTVGKAELVTGTQLALQDERIKANPKLAGAEDLISELRNYRVKQNEGTGNLSWNAREGEHDDIVLALCLAIYRGKLMGLKGVTRSTPSYIRA